MIVCCCPFTICHLKLLKNTKKGPLKINNLGQATTRLILESLISFGFTEGLKSTQRAERKYLIVAKISSKRGKNYLKNTQKWGQKESRRKVSKSLSSISFRSPSCF